MLPNRADTVFTGGTVHTLDATGRLARALAVRGGRIAAVGAEAEVTPLIGPRTRVIALDGRSVLPGVNDSHLHGVWLGALWPDLLMDRLTRSAPDHSEARPAEIRLTTGEQRRAAILRTGRILAGLGITSYTEPGLGPGEDEGPTGCFGAAALRDYATLAEEGRLTARVTALMLFGELDGPSSVAGLREGLRTFRPPAEVPGRLRVAGVKIFADGIPPMGTAWTDQPYGDGGHGGLLVEGSSPEALAEMIALTHEAGYQAGVHATGGRAVRAAAAAMAKTAGKGRDLRHYIIHGDLAAPDTLAVMARAGIGLTTQPGIAVATADMLAAALGPEALRRAWPLREALAAGVRLCLSSDAPVVTPDWRLTVAQATARGLTLDAALRACTVVPAWQDGAEGWKGTLEPGKAADLCVLGGSLREVEPAALPEVPVVLTMVDGRIVHEAGV
ncbi:amidohydrolase [Nonomuraea typhae]|uniref:amidohydrolase n=1 Tax=Nonomuraea typhae TaxID=2603600 RepID=UPI0012F7BC22|nr:amidohydrolase family protein [Nonomuraea typhae]